MIAGTLPFLTVQSAALASPHQSSAVPDLEPSLEITLPNTLGIYSIHFSPDGETLSAHVVATPVDLLKVGLAVWPEFVGGINSLLLVVWLLVLRRVLRRRRTPGLPFCRKCNYNLVEHAPDAVKRRPERRSPLPGTRCPECGVDLTRRRPVRGRSSARRLLLPTLLMVLFTAGYVSMWVGRLPRNPIPFPEWTPLLHSTLIDRIAVDWDIQWLISKRSAQNCIVSISARSGKVLSTFHLGRQPFDAYSPSRSGRYFAAAQLSRDGRVWCYRSGENRLLGATSAVELGYPNVTGVQLLGISDGADQPRVFLSLWRSSEPWTRIVEWRPLSGASDLIHEGTSLQAKLLDRPDGPALLVFHGKSAPTLFATAVSSDGTDRMIESGTRDISGGAWERFELLAFSRDCSLAHFQDLGGTRTADLGTGQWIKGRYTPVLLQYAEDMACSPSGRLILARNLGWKRSVLCDADLGLEIAGVSAGAREGHPVFSPDERRLVLYAGPPSRNLFICTVRLYDIPSRPGAADENENPPDAPAPTR